MIGEKTQPEFLTGGNRQRRIPFRNRDSVPSVCSCSNASSVAAGRAALQSVRITHSRKDFFAEAQRRRENQAGRFFFVFLCASAPLRETFPRHGFGCGGPRCDLLRPVHIWVVPRLCACVIKKQERGEAKGTKTDDRIMAGQNHKSELDKFHQFHQLIYDSVPP